MARSISAAVRQIKSELNEHLTADDIHGACVAVGHDWRERVAIGGKNSDDDVRGAGPVSAITGPPHGRAGAGSR